MKYQIQRGTNDILPVSKDRWLESHRWIQLENDFRAHSALYGYAEVRTPMFEDYDMFVRSAGETTDIVSKEMYDFTDKGDRHIALRPELTAPAIRALISGNLCPTGTVARLSYLGPLFRYERPGLGRFRQAHQVGLELVGSPSVAADAEIIEITVRFYQKLGIQDASARISSLGRDECRMKFRQVVLDHAEPWLRTQELEVREKAEKNPLRLLDSKDEEVLEVLAGVPPITDYLEEEGKQRFEGLQELLTEADVPFSIDTGIVRGLDYYTDTVFEIHSGNLGSQSALCGGGRYDNLVKELGGQNLPSVGVGMGIERCLLVLDALGLGQESPGIDVFVILAMPDVFDTVRTVAADLRKADIRTLTDVDQKSLKSQMGQADRAKAKFALIIGVDELTRGSLTLRRMADSSQESIPLANVVEEIKKRL